MQHKPLSGLLKVFFMVIQEKYIPIHLSLPICGCHDRAWPLHACMLPNFAENGHMLFTRSVVFMIHTHCNKSTPSSVHFVFSCDQAALWMVQSVCLSVCLSVCPSVRLSVTPFWLCSHHRIIMSYYQWKKWRPCKWSRSEVKGQCHRGHNLT